MLFKSKLKKLFILLLASPLLFISLYGQQYNLRQYGNGSMLPNPFVYAITQDDHGYIWISTGEGLSKFDGRQFFNVVFPDSSFTRYATAAMKDNEGDLWFGCDDGAVYKYEDGELKRISFPNTSPISDIVDAGDGYVWVVPQNENIYKISCSNSSVKTFPIEQGDVMFSAMCNSDGNLMVGSQDYIAIYKEKGNNELAIVKKIEGFDYAGVSSILNVSDNVMLVGTSSSGLFRMETAGTGSLYRFDDYPELENISIQSLFKDSDGYIWISTYDSGVYRIFLDETNSGIKSLNIIDTSSGLTSNNVVTTFEDVEGNMWFGTSGEGLSIMTSMAFSQNLIGKTRETQNIIYISQYDNQIFCGTLYGYFLLDGQTDIAGDLVDLRKNVNNAEISAYYVGSDKKIWIGTTGRGLFVLEDKKVKQVYRSGDTSEDYITDIEVRGGKIWLGSLNGLVILDEDTGTFLKKFNIDNGLSHNKIENILFTKQGKCAVALKTDRLYLIDYDSGISYASSLMYGSTINIVLAYGEDSMGHIWAATSGNGMFEIMGDSIRTYNKNDGMMSDYCYSILVDHADRVWIGHDRGFSRYDINTGIIKTFASEFSGEGVCNQNAIFEAKNNKIYIGTTQGVVIYDYNKDIKASTAPINNINYVEINNVVYPFKDSYTLPYRKNYVIRVNYTGINFNDPNKVYYQTRLKNWLDEWSDWTTETEVVFSPRDGRYVFEMNSINEDGLSSNTASFNLLIKKPVWRTWWFLSLLFLAIALAVFLIIREREKKQKEIEEYLKTELDKRTKEVKRQKEEIQAQNIEITDSINYAKRIQNSILPDTNKLSDVFKDSFVFFMPRDIVSGDFYWFDTIDDDKFILVCADSTGHGVPGAFMSMIGVTLLQDIITRQKKTNPAEILGVLDEHIFNTLNQNSESGVTTNDGMDMVVCEIDLKTKRLRFASAMRPVILNIGGESLYVRGDRCAVGGGSSNEKFFSVQEYYLSEGDAIYLFSDGLPDQFGGPNNKKLKIHRMKQLLENVYDKSMSEQREIIKNFYEEWRGDYEQVDDILLIGVRF